MTNFPLWKNVDFYFFIFEFFWIFYTMNKNMKQLAFFMNPSLLSWKIISWFWDHIFNGESPYFHGLWYFYLTRWCSPQQNEWTYKWCVFHGTNHKWQIHWIWKVHGIEECPRTIYNFIRFWIGKTMGSSAPEVFGHSRSSSSWFQIQPVTCWHLPVWLSFIWGKFFYRSL